MDINFKDGEKIIKKGGANWSKIFQSKGGHLYLNDERLLFIGHGKNIGNDSFAINLADIKCVKIASTISFWAGFIPIPNAIKIEANNGKITKFTVSGRKDWVEQINKAMKV